MATKRKKPTKPKVTPKPVSGQNPAPPSKPRPPAEQLLLNFLKLNKMNFIYRKQEVRYLEDKGILIEPPAIVVFYEDQLKRPTQQVAPKKNAPSKT